MKRSRFSEQQIAFILHQAEEGVAVEDVCRKAGISIQTYYRWRKKYGGLMPSEMKRLKLLEEENARLKRLVADLSLDAAARAPHPVQWLADNGSAYTARETLEFAIALGLVACCIPVEKPRERRSGR